MDPVSRHALNAAREALQQAGFVLKHRGGKSTAYDVEGLDATRTAVLVGTGMGGLSTLEASHEHYREAGGGQGGAWVRFGLPKLIPNAAAAELSIRFGLQGESRGIVSACAAGTMAIGEGLRLITAGHADVVLAGGSEAVLSTHDGLGLMGFDVLGAMSTRNDDPAAASRPFDRDRDGFVLSEGAGILVLESEDHAAARGAEPLGHVLAYGAASQAHSMLQPQTGGATLRRVMSQVLAEEDLAAAEVGQVNAHATSTPAGDIAEATAIRAVFGDQGPPVTATKSVTGHAIAASGAFEAIVTLASMQRGLIPPTANLEHVGEGCELDHVTGQARSAQVEISISLSSGFGGHDAALVLGRA